MKLLSRYILREILSPFLIAIFVFTGVLFLIRSLKLIDLLINKNAHLFDIILLFSYIIPRFLEIAIPMAVLIGVILAFGRFSADSELVVMRASGISFRELIKPLGVFAILATATTMVISLWIRPAANYRLGLGLFEMAKAQISSGIIPGIFNNFGTLTIYSEQFDNKTGVLKNVIISDRRDPKLKRTFIAKNGEIASDNAQRTLSMVLYDGIIREGTGLDYNITYFETNNINLQQSELLEGSLTEKGKKSDEMPTLELSSAIKEISALPTPLDPAMKHRLARYRVEFHRRFVLPFACLCVAIIAMVLGIQPSRSGHSWGHVVNILLGIIAILIYYLLLAFATALGEQNIAPIPILLWLPNLIFGLLAWFFYSRMESERWMAVSQALGSFLYNLTNRIGSFRRGSESS